MNFYLNKYRFLPPQLTAAPDADLGTIVVIPCFNEPDLLSSLKSLAACQPTEKKVEVIVVFNAGAHHREELKLQNQKSLSDAQQWLAESDESFISFQFMTVHNLPEKHAGVGLARKVGMDEAVARFHQIGQDGIIVCFDADSLCDTNYLAEIEKHFKQFPKTPGCSIYFEHPLSGDEPAVIYTGITLYELHLRYYHQVLRYCNLPYAFHTIGSSMAVRSSAYQKQGGMNKRKAGEDFYFLHKIISPGNFTTLNTTCVIPSPRISDRVPFGTGRAIGTYAAQATADYYTYNFNSFKLIKKFAAQIPALYQTALTDLNPLGSDDAGWSQLLAFLAAEKLPDDLPEIRRNSPSQTVFVKRFYVWFDAFRVLKLVHFLRDRVYPDEAVVVSANELLNAINRSADTDQPVGLLTHFRALDRMST
ncbi:MAG: glycosyltransferase family 2 protein [Bacteroidetes bacterium]|nr:glycosyltransferase family 2 protein [Bacteroidota bacterium]